MAHNLELDKNGKASMAYVGKTPWHNLGTEIPDGNIPYDEFLTVAGLDWTVRKVPLVTVESAMIQAQSETIEPDVDACAIVRESDGRRLGVVGPRYQPLQNKDAFKWFEPIQETGLVEWHTAGSLHNGEMIWALCKCKLDNSVIVPGDEVEKFIMLSNSHNGKTSVQVGFTPIRIVCKNTLAMAESNAASRLLRIRHTSGMNETLEKVREVMDIANQQFEATAEQYRWLASRRIVNPKDLREYVKVIMGFEGKDDDEISTKGINILNDVVDLCLTGLGNDNPEVEHTWYTAYNGVAEHLSYKSGRNDSTRLSSLWFGANATKNRKAFDLAMKMAQ